MTVQDMAFALGAFSPNHNHLELLDLKTWSWESRSNYHYHTGLNRHGNIPYGENFIVFGGYCSGNGCPSNSRVSVIAKYDVYLDLWSKLGDLLNARGAPNVILSNGYFLVFGSYLTEKCALFENEMSCIEQYPSVSNHNQLFYVEESFCQKKN